MLIWRRKLRLLINLTMIFTKIEVRRYSIGNFFYYIWGKIIIIVLLKTIIAFYFFLSLDEFSWNSNEKKANYNVSINQDTM